MQAHEMTRFRSIAERPNPLWSLGVGLLVVLLLVLVLTSCAGTVMSLKGQVCGQDVDLALTDRKDRSGFEATVECPGGGSVHISSTDSSTSAVVNALSAAMQSLTTLVAKVAGTAAAP
jgi:hypothetical protein